MIIKMHKTSLITLFILCFTFGLQAQVNSLSEEQVQQLEKFQLLIENGQIDQLAELVDYPLKRSNPIPDIQSKEKFILYYLTLFDKDFKSQLLAIKAPYEEVVSRSGMLGLLNGEIWINSSGRIISINYTSPEETKLSEELIALDKESLHSSLQNFKANIHLCECKDYKVRIDEMDDSSYRMALWYKRLGFDGEPFEIYTDVKMAHEGRMGDQSYTSEGGEYVNILEIVKVAEKDEDMGLFLKQIAMTEGLTDERFKCKPLK